MAKFLTGMGILAVLVGGVYWASQQKMGLGFLAGEKDVVKRGDLIIPITASGNIEPASVVNIKSEASGEVVLMPFEPGMMVRQGDLVIELREVDERRSVDRAESDVRKARTAVEQARSTLKRHQAGVPLAEARLAQAQARLEIAEATYEHRKQLHERDSTLVATVELTTARANYHEARSMIDAAKAELEQARVAVELADQDILVAQETLFTAEQTRDDALERLRETKIYSPIDGMILAQYVQVGEVVQSATRALLSGTDLMQIANMDRIYAVVHVDDADIGRVRDLAPPSARPGPTATRPATDDGLDMSMIDSSEPVVITVDSFPDEEFEGTIERISPLAERDRGITTFKVWIRVRGDNVEKLTGLLNTQADARFTVQAVTDALLVNWDAMRPNPDGDGFGVYVPVRKPGSDVEEPEFRLCRFGLNDGMYAEVLEGLEEGEEVYVRLPIKTERQRRAAEEAEAEDELY